VRRLVNNCCITGKKRPTEKCNERKAIDDIGFNETYDLSRDLRVKLEFK
jgi:hypothetical protein